MVPQPAFMAGEVMGPALRHFLRITKRGNGTTALSFPRMRTLSTPERNQFQFLDYAIRYWVPQTKHIKQSSRLWVKFEQLAKYQSETWNFHPWVNPGLSKTSRLHGLFGLAVKERHEPLLSIALNQGKYIRQNQCFGRRRLYCFASCSRQGPYRYCTFTSKHKNSNCGLCFKVKNHTPLACF